MTMHASEPESTPQRRQSTPEFVFDVSANQQLARLEYMLGTAWSKETSSDPDNWTPENPSWGQCAVTALVVQDQFGGELRWAEAQLPDGGTVSHYFNKLVADASGEEQEVDLTRQQFPEGTIVGEGVPKPKEFSSTREYVLSYPVTRERYERLCQALSTLED
jgi:hypothetical protein